MEHPNELKVKIERTQAVLESLVRINSVNPDSEKGGPGEQDIATWIKNYLEELGLEVFIQTVKPNRPNVIGIMRGKGTGPSLMLNGHMDTVGIGNMDIAPFEPVVKDGKLYGRGSSDMKSGVAAILICAETLVRRGVSLSGDLVLTLVMDEEYANLGTEAVVQEYTADAAIVTEPTQLQICTAHKGWGWERINVHGKAAHGSLPLKGIDAIVKAGKVLTAMDKLGQNLLQGPSHHLVGTPSIHAGQIEGGRAELNTYPDHCVIGVERRTIPGEDKQTIYNEMAKLLDDIQKSDPQFKADFEIFLYRSPLETPIDAPIVKSLQKSFRKLQGEEPALSGFSGWTDAATLQEAGIPTLVFGPMGEGDHAAVEFVDLKSVSDTAEILIETAINYCGCDGDMW